MSKMLKLFKVAPPKMEVVYFDSKRAAKAKRDRLNEQDGVNVAVLRGPDHRRGETFAQ